MHIDHLTSSQNPRIKDLQLLQDKSRHRRERGLFVVEGLREIKQSLIAGFHPEAIYYCDELLTEKDILKIAEGHNCQISSVSKYLYEKIAYRGSTEGIIGVLHSKSTSLSKIKLRENPLILVLESIEKPGNLGAILRTADASGVDLVIICDPLTDLYNPNIIRSSLGGVFSNTIVCTDSDHAINWLKTNKVNILTAQLQDSDLYYQIDMSSSTAIVLGPEDKGLSNKWREASNHKIRIPMLGELDSLNVSISGSILCYEALRQRNNNTNK